MAPHYQNKMNNNDLPSVLENKLIALDSEFWKTRLNSLKDFFLGLEKENRVICISDKSDELVKLGIIRSKQFDLLGVKEIIIISETARLFPKKLAALLDNLRKTAKLNETYKLLIEAIKNALICYREKKVNERSDIVRSDFSEYIHTNKFKIIEKYGDEETSHYDLEIKDRLFNKIALIRITTMNTLIDDKNDKRAFSIFATLPWYSPYLLTELNILFNLNWFLKYRLRYVKPDDCLEITYRWGHYEVDDPEAAKRDLIKDALEDTGDNRFSICPAGYNLETYDKKDEKYYCTMLRQLEEQLFYSIDSLKERPDLIKTEPFIYWDIGLVRGQIFLYNKKYNLFNLNKIISDEDAHTSSLKKLTKLIAKFIQEYSKKDRFPYQPDLVAFLNKLLKVGTVEEVIESISEFDKNVKTITKDIDEKYKAPLIVALSIMANKVLYKDGKPIDENLKITLIQGHASCILKRKKAYWTSLNRFSGK